MRSRTAGSKLLVDNGGVHQVAVVGNQYLVRRDAGLARSGTVLDIRTSKYGLRDVYVSFVGEDKRLDSWVHELDLGAELVYRVRAGLGEGAETTIPSAKKRKRQIDGSTTPVKLTNGHASGSVLRNHLDPTPSAASTPEREHAAMTRVRNFEDVRFGEYLIKTWYYSPYPLPLDEVSVPCSRPSTPLDIPNGHFPTSRKRKARSTDAELDLTVPIKQNKPRGLGRRTASDMFAAGVGKGGEGARGRLWVCDLCFKYMRTRPGYAKHTSFCTQLQPPGRKVYQRGSYTIWEVDGAHATLYSQNLSLFGKLFIDHKSVFFHVDNFLFYVLCDAATSRRDQVMAFFSKEKLSYDDYNLACIVTFPPFQNQGFGKLLIELSYYLTRHPSTRSTSESPGTPERPLSDLGLKGYTAYWIAVILRFCRTLLAGALPIQTTPKETTVMGEGRTLRARRENGHDLVKGVELVDGIEITKSHDSNFKGQYTAVVSLGTLAQGCHLRTDDTAFALAELGFLRHRRNTNAAIEAKEEHDLGEWKDVEMVVSREMVEEMWATWKVREKGVLAEEYMLL